MGVIDALLAPRASIEEVPWTDWGSKTKSGQTVNVTKAMRVVAVYACVTLITDAIRALPVDVLERRGPERVEVLERPGWVEAPNPDQTWGQFVTFALHSLLTSGNTGVWIASRDRMQFPETLYVVHPDDMRIQVPSHLSSMRLKEIWVHGRRVPEFTASHPEGQILHILGHTLDGVSGLSPIGQAKEAIGGALAVEQAGNEFWSQAALNPGVVEMPPGSNPAPEQLSTIGAMFRRKFAGPENAWKPIVLANGASYKPITMSREDAQFIDTRRFSVAEIARLYRVPPHLIGDVERSTSWGTGIEEQNIGFVQYTLMPWIRRLEESLSLLLPRGQFIRFNVNGLLRGDTTSRFSAYQVGVTNGFITRNEVRALEDLPPIEGGDVALVPLNLTQAGAGDDVQASTRELTEMIQKIYLGVGKVLTADEAREILNREGADLEPGFEPFPLPTSAVTE